MTSRPGRSLSLLLVPAWPVRIDFLLARTVPRHFPAVNTAPRTAGRCDVLDAPAGRSAPAPVPPRHRHAVTGRHARSLSPLRPPNRETLNKSVSAPEPCNARSSVSRAPRGKPCPGQGFSQGGVRGSHRARATWCSRSQHTRRAPEAGECKGRLDQDSRELGSRAVCPRSQSSCHSSLRIRWPRTLTSEELQADIFLPLFAEINLHLCRRVTVYHFSPCPAPRSRSPGSRGASGPVGHAASAE
ncbi:uncharacterized protein LOC118502189 [Phyllostomus discolor]|uniref:Uncharacterized protein LOC118502189 n=1 Tax=Phyllostomus discolor TaxID=89673 RepID=A0A7E6EEY2_9CHIR|nr:uncharacterized protein LOC118502189 [Phyllostomus discolor]